MLLISLGRWLLNACLLFSALIVAKYCQHSLHLSYHSPQPDITGNNYSSFNNLLSEGLLYLGIIPQLLESCHLALMIPFLKQMDVLSIPINPLCVKIFCDLVFLSNNVIEGVETCRPNSNSVEQSQQESILSLRVKTATIRIATRLKSKERLQT